MQTWQVYCSITKADSSGFSQFTLCRCCFTWLFQLWASSYLFANLLLWINLKLKLKRKSRYNSPTTYVANVEEIFLNKLVFLDLHTATRHQTSYIQYTDSRLSIGHTYSRLTMRSIHHTYSRLTVWSIHHTYSRLTVRSTRHTYSTETWNNQGENIWTVKVRSGSVTVSPKGILQDQVDGKTLPYFAKTNLQLFTLGEWSYCQTKWPK